MQHVVAGRSKSGRKSLRLRRQVYDFQQLQLHTKPGGAQIQFYMVILWKSQEISLLIKVFRLLSDHNKTCTKCRSTIEVLFHKVSLKLVKR